MRYHRAAATRKIPHPNLVNVDALKRRVARTDIRMVQKHATGTPDQPQSLFELVSAERRRAPAVYNVDVSEAGAGRFRATCRETGAEVISPNAEHDLCRLLTEAGQPDGTIQFWRGVTPSLSHSSIHKMGRYRIALGDDFPNRVKRREGGPEISSESVAGSTHTGVSDFPDPDSHPQDTGLPEERLPQW